MQEDTRLASGHVYQEMRGGARRCEEMRADTRRCEVIQGDTRRCEEMRGLLRGMSFSFILPLRRQQQDFRFGGGAWFILSPRRHQQDFRVEGGAWGLGPGTGGRLASFFLEGCTSWTLGLGAGNGD